MKPTFVLPLPEYFDDPLDDFEEYIAVLELMCYFEVQSPQGFQPFRIYLLI